MNWFDKLFDDNLTFMEHTIGTNGMFIHHLGQIRATIHLGIGDCDKPCWYIRKLNDTSTIYMYGVASMAEENNLSLSNINAVPHPENCPNIINVDKKIIFSNCNVSEKTTITPHWIGSGLEKLVGCITVEDGQIIDKQLKLFSGITYAHIIKLPKNAKIDPCQTEMFPNAIDRISIMSMLADDRTDDLVRLIHELVS